MRTKDDINGKIKECDKEVEQKSVIDKCLLEGRRQTKKSTEVTPQSSCPLLYSAFTKLNRKRIALVNVSSRRKCLSIVAVSSCGKYPILSVGDYFRS